MQVLQCVCVGGWVVALDLGHTRRYEVCMSMYIYSKCRVCMSVYMYNKKENMKELKMQAYVSLHCTSGKLGDMSSSSRYLSFTGRPCTA
jgi:hypothetical protein